MEGHECSITFYNEESESGEEVVGYLKCPFPPDVGDDVYIKESNGSWQVTRRRFMWPSPGSMTYNSGGRYPIMDIMVKPVEPFFHQTAIDVYREKQNES